MPHIILRFVKMKGNPTKAFENHRELHFNGCGFEYMDYHIMKPSKSYYEEIQSRIEKSGYKVRVNSIKFIDTLVTASPDFFIYYSLEEIKIYFEMSVDFLNEKLVEDNIFSAVVHMNDKIPHMHLCFVPITEDKRLPAKEIIGNRNNLLKWHNEFNLYMSKKYKNLEWRNADVEND